VNVETKQSPDNLKVFVARCEARAVLWQLDELSLHDAVDVLEAWRKQLGLDADTAQLAMARAFSRVRDDLAGWVVP
jgi:hypothetical protein